MRRTSLFVEELKSQRKSIEVPPTEMPVKPMSSEDELHLLEKKAKEKGMGSVEFEEIQGVGNCPVQIQTRIESLHQWLAAH